MLRTCLQRGFSKSEIRWCFKNKKIMFTGQRTPKIISEFHSSDDNIARPSELDPGLRHLLIFDDILLENNKIIQEFYLQGRHSNVSVILLSQNYFLVDRSTIRCNVNLLIIFAQSFKNINHIFADIQPEIEFEEFKTFCTDAWKEKYGFIVLDLDSTIENGKYRRGFSTFYLPKILFEEKEGPPPPIPSPSSSLQPLQ